MAVTINFRGIAFPFQVGTQSFPKEATNEDLIKQSIVQIIVTQPGERYMRPEFGCGALNFIFEPDDASLAAYIQDTVARSIARWETRVVVNAVRVERNTLFEAQLIVTVEYTIKATAQTQNASVTLGSP
jgi:uncharacterized protein